MAGCGHSRCEKWPACVERRKGQGRVEHSYQASWHCSKPYMSNVMDPHTSAFRQLLLTRSSTGKNIRPWKAKSLASPKYIIIYHPSSRNHSCSSYSGLVLTEATNYLTLKKKSFTISDIPICNPGLTTTVPDVSYIYCPLLDTCQWYQVGVPTDS